MSINLYFSQTGVEGRVAIAPDKQPLPEGKGFGDGVREFALFSKNRLFLQFTKIRVAGA